MGNAQLIELTQPSPMGPVTVLQSIFVKNNKATILTAALAKKDLSLFQEQILNAFQSLASVEDLWSVVKDENSLKRLKSFYEKKQWEEFEKAADELTDLGPYWKYLIIKEGIK